MRLVIQRVTQASVAVPAQGYESKIGKGLMVLVAFMDEDTEEDLMWTARKLVAMRIFDDAEGVMNLSVQDVGGDVMLVSQFTLYASTVKGNRPSYIKAAKPDVAIPIYQKLIESLQQAMEKEIATGEFGADMKVDLTNDGPVTIIMDSQNKE